MGIPASNFSFSIPYEIAVARPLRQTTAEERAAALRAAHYNTELIPQNLIYVDLCTDSGVSALSTAQLAVSAGANFVEPGMGLAPEGSRAFALLAEQVRRAFDFPYFIATTQGRSAERLWAKVHFKPDTLVLGNMLFPSTRAHIEMSGTKVIDVIGEAAHDLTSPVPFKGNVDLDKLAAAITEHGASNIKCVYVELAVNACGGHPISLANLAQVKTLAAEHQIPLFLDACRILENSYLLQQREADLHDCSVAEIVRRTCALADACTMSALKDFLMPSGGLILTRDHGAYQKAAMQSFLDGVQLSGSAMEQLAAALSEVSAGDAYIRSRVEQVRYLWERLKDKVPVARPPAGHAVFIDVKSFLPHLPAEKCPAESLAAFLYELAGIRITKGPPAAPSQAARGVDLLRLAVPARKYLPGHLDDAAEAVIYAFEHRHEIAGLSRIADPSRTRHQPGYFEPL